MTNKLKLSVSAAALSLLLAGGVSSAQTVDVVASDPGCGLSGSVMGGYMYNWQDVSTHFGFDDNIESKDIDIDGDPDWHTPFAEGAAVFTCHDFNIQADFAWYDHQNEIDSDIEDKDGDNIEQESMHVGAALFYREPDSFAVGISGSKIEQDFGGKDPDIWRAGVFGEVYLGDTFTFGASAHYYSHDFLANKDDDFASKDEDGFELAAWGRFYPTPDLSLMIRGDVLLPNADLDIDLDVDADWNIDDGWAITGEAEYLVWDNGLTIFGGARYAERSWSLDVSAPTPPPFFKLDSDIEDLQVYAGLKFYFDFGKARTLVQDHRTGAYDNTSVFHEKLPEIMSSTSAGLADGADEDDFPPP